MRWMTLGWMLLMLAAARQASAFTPENGFWWNAAEAGRGFTIEIQDNYLFMIGYVYRADGSSTFVTTQGLMQGNAAFQGQMDTFSNGQCTGCAYAGFPTIQQGAGGPVSIQFLSETTARMTWNGGVTPLTRFDFYLTRSSGDPRVEMMLGEWQVILDYANVPGFNGYPYFGDVLVFDERDTSAAPDIFVGCRADNSVDGRCSTQAQTNSEAAGYFDAASGAHVIVVDNGDNFLVYAVEVGTYQFDGFATTCPLNLSLAQCLAGGVDDVPVRGFRSASRSFVQAGVGPNRADTDKLAQSTAAAQPLPALAVVAEADRSEARLARYGIDVRLIDPLLLSRLEARVRR